MEEGLLTYLHMAEEGHRTVTENIFLEARTLSPQRKSQLSRGIQKRS